MADIHCPNGLFPRQEAEITQLIQAINHAPTAGLKLPWAQDLIRVVDDLLACPTFDENSLDCCLCRNFSQLRHKTATLVIKAGRLDERG